MSAHPGHDWHRSNQQLLLARLASVREALARYVERTQTPTAGEEAESSAAPAEVESRADELEREASPASEGGSASSSSALDALCAGFGLSPFERDVLLMCAGVELDASFAALCTTAQGEGRRAHPTFGLALAALPGAHWSALSPAAPLRYWRLLEVEPGQQSLTQARLRIDERVLHHLTGVNYVDERLWGLFHPVATPDLLPPSHVELAERLARLWSEENAEPVHPLVALGGEDPAGKRAVAAAAASMFGFDLWAIDSADVPQQVAEREALARLWNREAVLRGSALLLDDADGEARHAVLSFAESVRGMTFFASRDTPRLRRRLFAVEVKRPSAAEQQMLWRSALGPAAEELNGALETLISNFSLGAEGIHAAAAQAREALARGGEVEGEPAEALWSACRVRGRAKLDDLAQRIEPAAGWADIVLPDYQLRTLREIAAHVRQRATVYERWGFASRGPRGLGISALFAGPSGTGKTMAAEVLAADLRLDLYRIDLSSVVSKYIGETEKNLRRVFDAAEESGAVLLFDEADALFGKRSEVKDSHDRYANIEVSYLLQRMEAYRGLAILTTNLKTSLDHSFMRRLRFVVQFPFPDAAQRAEIWRRVFPPGTPTAGLQYDKLARLNVAGGNIRNIALNAAFIAADAGEAVSMAHLLQAAGSEYDKLEKPLTGAEGGGWL
ncbi:MAG TPA: ATP-binding protein [Pyrinomonadaceae bacterium]|nr:ATP-binding protein [Pyrinomonadaceae bacterium]